METAEASEETRPDFLNGVKFKAKEAELSTTLKSPYAVLRVDGRSFTSFTRAQGYDFPYDLNFMAAMDAVASALLSLVDGSLFAYVQSDEVSVAFETTGPEDLSSLWFGGKLQKLVSLSAAQASLAFFKAELARTGQSDFTSLFDSRVLALDSAQEVEEYLRWRRFDAQKNSVSMAAGSLFSPPELHGVSTRERHALLQGTAFEKLPEGFFNGRLFYRTRRTELMLDRKSGAMVKVARTEKVSHAADRSFVEKALPQLLEHRVYGQLQ